jgi:iron-sulfur cluster repair protein YtfE (RIC family)
MIEDDEIISKLLGRDHESLAKLLDELQLALTKHDPAKSFELLDLFWARLAMHIRAENLCLFPAILDAAESRNAVGMPTFGEAEVVIESLRGDHNFFMDQLAQAVKATREMTRDETITPSSEEFEAIRDRVIAVRARLIPHNEIEEAKVYEWSALLLGPGELNSLSVALKRELDNMPQRFGQK